MTLRSICCRLNGYCARICNQRYRRLVQNYYGSIERFCGKFAILPSSIIFCILWSVSRRSLAHIGDVQTTSQKVSSKRFRVDLYYILDISSYHQTSPELLDHSLIMPSKIKSISWTTILTTVSFENRQLSLHIKSHFIQPICDLIKHCSIV